MITIEHDLNQAQSNKLHSQWSALVKKAAQAGIQVGADGDLTGKVTGRVEVFPSKIKVTISKWASWVPEFVVRNSLEKMLSGFLG